MGQLGFGVFMFMLALGPKAEGRTSPKWGGTFLDRLEQAPKTLNPLSSTDAYASEVHSRVIESLLSRDIDSYQWVPTLAGAWEISQDGMEYTFTLREGVQWHDGKPLVPQDVVFSFEAIVHPENKYATAHKRPYFENIQSVEIVGKNQIKFKAKRKYFLNFDIVAGMDILPQHIYENPSKAAKKKLNRTLIGTGPYILSPYKKRKNMILKANPHWWGRGVAHTKDRNFFDQTLIRFVEDSTIAITRLEKGDLDFLVLEAEDYVKKAKGKKWGKEIFKFRVQNKAPKRYDFIGWNLENSLFQSRDVRRALAHLLNRKLMIQKFRYGFSKPATGPMHYTSDYADPEVTPIGFDPQGALEMLKKAGWRPNPKGPKILVKTVKGKLVNFSFTIITASEPRIKYLTVFKEDAKKVGVDVKIKQVDWSTFIKLLNEKKFDAVAMGWGGGGVEWDPKQIWHSSSSNNQGSNFISYKNPQVDQLIEEARIILDRDTRIKKLRKVYALIAADAPYAFLFNDMYTFYAHSKRMQKPRETYQYGLGVDRWWIEK